MAELGLKKRKITLYSPGKGATKYIVVPDPGAGQDTTTTKLRDQLVLLNKYQVIYDVDENGKFVEKQSKIYDVID